MIAIVDTGGANTASIRNAFERLGAASEVTADPARIRAAERVVLPGVGAAGESMRRIRDAGLVDLLGELRQPVLGICLGMQLLFESSDEDDAACLGWLPGRVRALAAAPGRPVPHMGWNAVEGDGDWPLLRGLDGARHFYFVHSFAAPDGPWVPATTTYGDALPAGVQRDNVLGVQFHPERSGPAGARVLANFLEL